MYKILIIGPQASGKGTQAVAVANQLNLPVFSSGNTLRQRSQENDELGQQIKATINQGNLVSDEIMNNIFKEKIEQAGQDGYILDGYPRNLTQAEFLDSFDQEEE